MFQSEFLRHSVDKKSKDFGTFWHIYIERGIYIIYSIYIIIYIYTYSRVYYTYIYITSACTINTGENFWISNSASYASCFKCHMKCLYNLILYRHATRRMHEFPILQAQTRSAKHHKLLEPQDYCICSLPRDIDLPDHMIKHLQGTIIIFYLTVANRHP